MNNSNPESRDTLGEPSVERQEGAPEQSAEQPSASVEERKLDVRGQGTERYVALQNGQTDVPVEYVTSRGLIASASSELQDSSIRVSEKVSELLKEGKREEAELLMHAELKEQHDKGEEADVMSRSIRRIAVELGVSNIMRVKPGTPEKPSIDTSKLGANGNTIREAATVGNVFVVPPGLNEQIAAVFKEESAKAISQSDVRYRTPAQTDADYDSSNNYFRVQLETDNEQPIELFFLIGHEDQDVVKAEEEAREAGIKDGSIIDLAARRAEATSTTDEEEDSSTVEQKAG